MKYSQLFLIISAVIMLAFFVFSFHMPIEAFYIFAAAFFSSFSLYTLSLYAENRKK
jgi:hypothetical protein